MLLRYAVLASLCLLINAIPKPAAKCGYESCPVGKPGMLNVHLVPHSHDDVGWLKTVDQYYYGSRTKTQNAGVQYILDSVVQELLHDPKKRFIWVETAYLWQWWREQNDHLRHQVKTLVNSGQLEIIGGGWSMNDEAVTHYQSTIDQFTWGFRKLNDTFGSCGRPHVGWQIDPFGHSREEASIMARMGFDGLFVGRVDYQDKEHRLKSKTPEFVWQASENLGESSWLFSHVLYHNYSPPPGFCFDILCDDDPIIDNKKSPEYNVDEKVKLFLTYAEVQSQSYRSNNIIMTMGQDFNYQSARVWFKNMDKLIRCKLCALIKSYWRCFSVNNFLEFVRNQSRSYKTNNIILTMGEDFFYQDAHISFMNMDKLIRYVNAAQSHVNVFYSTPSCYLKAVHDTNMTWTSKKDDFFPYPSDANSYWTGYFTSRPTLKYFERMGNNFLQVCKQLYALADLGPEDWTDLNAMREAMGIMQHHDAITGTEQQHVAEDYAMRLTQAFKECHFTADTAINKLMKKDDTYPHVEMEPCMLLNISECTPTERNEKFVVTVYNPLSQVTSHFIRLPVAQAPYKVYDNQEVQVPVQMVPIPEPVLNIPGRSSTAKQELVFKAVDIPALGYKSYYVEKQAGTMLLDQTVTGNDKHTLGNQHVRIRVDADSGRLAAVTVNGKDTNVDQNFFYYESAEGDNNEPKNRSSGAYIFRPRSPDPVSVGKANTTTIKGPVVQELHQQFSSWVSQVIRIYEGEPSLELEWLVGPIPIDDKVGKEVISRFSTNWPTEGVFYTDSNGREMLQRKRNWRPTWKVNISEPVSGNYYPVTTTISIKTKDVTLSVLPDRAQGGSSLKDGDVELMVHRRLLHDDAFGVGEALNETAFGTGLVARGRHIVVLGSNSNVPTTSAQQRQLVNSRMVMSPWLLVAPTELTFQQFSQQYYMQFAGLKADLPPNVHLLTLEPWKGSSLLIRLEHFFEKTDDPKLSKSVTVNLKSMFAAFEVVSVRETTLGGNQWLNENARFSWSVETNEIPTDDEHVYMDPPTSNQDFAVQLKPMQIRTFVIEIKARECLPLRI